MRKLGIVLLVFLLSFTVLAGCGSPKETVLTESSWESILEKEIAASKQMEALFKDMADMYSSYLSFELTGKEFKEHVLGFRKRYATVGKEMSKYFATHKPVGKNEQLEAGFLSLFTARLMVGQILDKTLDTKGQVIERDQLLPYYMAQSQNIEKAISNFKLCISITPELIEQSKAK